MYAWGLGASLFPELSLWIL